MTYYYYYYLANNWVSRAFKYLTISQNEQIITSTNSFERSKTH